MSIEGPSWGLSNGMSIEGPREGPSWGQRYKGMESGVWTFMDIPSLSTQVNSTDHDTTPAQWHTASPSGNVGNKKTFLWEKTSTKFEQTKFNMPLSTYNIIMFNIAVCCINRALKKEELHSFMNWVLITP
jgi:hypothetical protein